VEYSRIGTIDKRNVVAQRIAQLEAEHYAQSLSLKQIDAQDDGSEGITDARNQILGIMSNLDVAHGLLVQELEALGGSADLALVPGDDGTEDGPAVVDLPRNGKRK
jgi:hypothetical protein